MKRFIAANWKMNLSITEAKALAQKVVDTYESEASMEGSRIMLAPPFVYLTEIAKIVQGSSIILAAQNSADELSGAYTGEVSPTMLKDIGVQMVILGHSERRRLFHESDQTIHKKVLLALECGLDVVLCVGETLEEREAGTFESVLERQLSSALQGIDERMLPKLSIAYEPVWAIGTGKTASCTIANEAHLCIREQLKSRYGTTAAENMYILYGGSVHDKNISELLGEQHIDGALIGTASLKENVFCSIMKG